MNEKYNFFRRILVRLLTRKVNVKRSCSMRCIDATIGIPMWMFVMAGVVGNHQFGGVCVSVIHRTGMPLSSHGLVTPVKSNNFLCDILFCSVSLFHCLIFSFSHRCLHPVGKMNTFKSIFFHIFIKFSCEFLRIKLSFNEFHVSKRAVNKMIFRNDITYLSKHIGTICWLRSAPVLFSFLLCVCIFLTDAHDPPLNLVRKSVRTHWCQERDQISRKMEPI